LKLAQRIVEVSLFKINNPKIVVGAAVGWIFFDVVEPERERGAPDRISRHGRLRKCDQNSKKDNSQRAQVAFLSESHSFHREEQPTTQRRKQQSVRKIIAMLVDRFGEDENAAGW